jgi:hypothetical protein
VLRSFFFFSECSHHRLGFMVCDFSGHHHLGGIYSHLFVLNIIFPSFAFAFFGFQCNDSSLRFSLVVISDAERYVSEGADRIKVTILFALKPFLLVRFDSPSSSLSVRLIYHLRGV